VISLSICHLKVTSKTDAINSMSLSSEVALNQISSLLYDRVALSTIGYNPALSNFESIYSLEEGNFTIIEWIGVSSEPLKARYYSGFVDMNNSDRDNNRIVSYSQDINTTGIDEILGRKFININHSDLAFGFCW